MNKTELRIEAVETFLNEWRTKTKTWMEERIAEYYKLKKDAYNLYQVMKARIQNENGEWIDNPNYVQSIADYKEQRIKVEQFIKANRMIHKLIFGYGRELASKRLENFLDKEVEAKRSNLIMRVEKKAGTIKDASGLFIGENCEINGIIVGDKARVNVYTITAGGYNIQCWHFRVLIQIIK